MSINIIEIELSSLCNAKCSACRRTMLDDKNVSYYKGNISFYDVETWFNDIDLTKTKFKLCGVLGDPMIAPDLIDIIFYLLYEKNVREIEMSTNGGTRPIEFWKELGLLSNKSNKRFYIHWAIDGATRNDYRENVVLNKVWENVDAYHSTGGHSIWQYIIFDYNKHEVDEARQIAKEKGMKFATRNSWRNNAKKAKIKSSLAKEIETEHYEDLEKRANAGDYERSNIICRHKIKNEYYIGSDGSFWPCCHLYDEYKAREIEGKTDEIMKLYKNYGDNFNDLNKHHISDIMNNEWFKILEDSFEKDHPMHLSRCYLSCGDNGKRAVIKNVED